MNKKESERGWASIAAAMAKYRTPSNWRSIFQVTSTLVLMFAGFAAAYLSMVHVSYLLSLVFMIPTAGWMVKIFCIQHDCGHGSYLKSKRANDLLGLWLGILTLTPYYWWRKYHSIHHATSGNLDRRGQGGEIFTMTVKEYESASKRKRFGYRLYRNPLVMFLVGPVWSFVIRQRFTKGVPETWKPERFSVHFTNIGMVVLWTAMVVLLDWRMLVLIYLPTSVLAGAIGIWLFYVQHQFEEGFWRGTPEWDYYRAAMHGSSYYNLPKILQWFTASIGLHHIHHLDSRIPNYRLQKVHDEVPAAKEAPELRLFESIKCARLKLWDEENERMVGFDYTKRAGRSTRSAESEERPHEGAA